MSSSRIVIVVVAGVAALLLAFLVHGMIAKPKPAPVAAASAPAAPPMTRVLTARVDLAVGDRLSQQNMAWQSWPVATVNDAYVTDGSVITPTAGAGDAAVKQARTAVTDMATNGGPKLQAMIGSIVKEPLYAGEPITSRKVVRSGDSGYMAVRLPEGDRAMSIPVNVESGVAGFIQPGDRVDILTSKGAGQLAQVVMANVKVLAVDQLTATPKGVESTPGAATLTLEVPADDVEMLAAAKTAGGLTLALRSYADIGGGSGSGGSGHGVRMFRGGGAAEMVTAQ